MDVLHMFATAKIELVIHIWTDCKASNAWS